MPKIVKLATILVVLSALLVLGPMTTRQVAHADGAAGPFSLLQWCKNQGFASAGINGQSYICTGGPNGTTKAIPEGPNGDDTVCSDLYSNGGLYGVNFSLVDGTCQFY